MSKHDGFLHIYSQFQWHDSAHIIGNEEALRRLRDAIDHALENGSAHTEAYTSDGEGFLTIVVKAEEKTINALTMPYQDEVAKGQGGPSSKMEPWDLEKVQEVERKARE